VEARLISRGISENKCSVIPNEPNLKLFINPYSEKSNKNNFIIVYHGNISEQNGLHILIKAINLIKDIIPSLLVKIIGDVRMNFNIEKLITKLNLSKFITYAILYHMKYNKYNRRC